MLDVNFSGIAISFVYWNIVLTLTIVILGLDMYILRLKLLSTCYKWLIEKATIDRAGLNKTVLTASRIHLLKVSTLLLGL